MSAAAMERIIRLTRREYFADFFITPPITAGLAIYSIRQGFGTRWVIAFALGWLAWTLYEYVVHRWVSHHLLWFIHGLHHQRQRDYIALHPVVTLAFYAFFWIVCGVRASAFMIGFSTGYIVYSGLHTAYHYLRIDVGSPLYAGRRRHVMHHRYETVCFGVTHGLWDRLLGTEKVS